MSEEDQKRSKALDGLAKLSQEMEKSRKQYEADNDSWWNGLLLRSTGSWPIARAKRHLTALGSLFYGLRDWRCQLAVCF